MIREEVKFKDIFEAYNFDYSIFPWVVFEKGLTSWDVLTLDGFCFPGKGYEILNLETDESFDIYLSEFSTKLVVGKLLMPALNI